MGLKANIGKVLSSLIRTRKTAEPEIKATLYAGNTIYASRFQGSGVDAPPLPGDSVLVIGVDNRGGQAALGFVDIINASTVDPGERRVYSRDENGVIQAEIYLKSSGLLEIQNTVQVLSTLIDDLFTEIKAITTAGTASAQAVDAATQTRFDALLTKYKQLFG